MFAEKPTLQQGKRQLSSCPWTCFRQLNDIHRCSHIPHGQTRHTDHVRREPRIDKLSQHQRNQHTDQRLVRVGSEPGTGSNHQPPTTRRSQLDLHPPPDHSIGPITTRTDHHRWPDPNSAGEVPGKPGKFGQVPRKNASRPTQQSTLFYLAVTVLSSTNTTLAGVAQSVERVALINSKEINLKVVGSSPTFGYSYHTSSTEQLFFCSFDGGLVGGELLFGEGAVCCCGVGCLEWMTLFNRDNQAQAHFTPDSWHSFVLLSAIRPISLTIRADPQRPE